MDFIGRQLHLDGEELGDYAVRSETRHEQLAELRRLYGFRSFSGGAARELVERLREEGAPGAVERGPGPEVRRSLPAHADHPAGHDDDRNVSAPMRSSTRNAGSKPPDPVSTDCNVGQTVAAGESCTAGQAAADEFARVIACRERSG